jgi:hypothetical protein
LVCFEQLKIFGFWRTDNRDYWKEEKKVTD